MKIISSLFISFFVIISTSVKADSSGTKVALVPGGPHPYFAAWEKAGQDAVKDFGLGKADYRVPAEWDLSQQPELIESLVGQGYNAVLVFPGDAVGILLRGIEREDIARGAVLAKPGSISPKQKAKAQVYVLTKDEGGRHTPFFTGYKPQFYIRTTDVTGEAHLEAGTEMVMPGDNTEMDIELMYPVALEENLRFAIREGGKTVGSGVITSIS